MHRPYNVDNGDTPMTTDRPHGHRRSIRLPGYDYAQPGAYFVTICTQDGECLFDDPILRRVAETMWQHIPNHFGQVSTDASVVMPNHMHGILIIRDVPTVGARHSSQDSPLTTQPASRITGSNIHDHPGNASPSPAPHAADEDKGDAFPTGHFVARDLPSLAPIALANVAPGNASPLQSGSHAADGNEGDAFPAGHFGARDLPLLAPIAMTNVSPGNASPLQSGARAAGGGDAFPTGHLGARDLAQLAPIAMAKVSAGSASPLKSGAPTGSLGAIVGNYKSITTRRMVI